MQQVHLVLMWIQICTTKYMLLYYILGYIYIYVLDTEPSSVWLGEPGVSHICWPDLGVDSWPWGRKTTCWPDLWVDSWPCVGGGVVGLGLSTNMAFFCGQRCCRARLVHEYGVFCGRRGCRARLVHENGCFCGQRCCRAGLVHENGRLAMTCGA